MFLIMAELFAAGLIIGSFLNVLIFRIPRHESIAWPPSHCPACSHPLAGHDNIPVVSFVRLRGRCRYCGHPISLQYPVVELLTAALLVLVFIKFGLSVKALVAFVFATMILLAAAIDLGHKIIPNRVVFPAGLAGVCLVLLGLSGLPDFLPLVGNGSAWSALAGSFIGGGILLLPALINENWMGGGDIKLMAVAGLFLGTYVLIALFVGSLAGSVTGVGLMRARKLKKGQPLPFGPFLAVGSLAALFFGPEMWSAYTSLWF
ncbi:MAG: prepilin peptidase [Terriglobia bacterium]